MHSVMESLDTVRCN